VRTAGGCTGLRSQKGATPQMVDILDNALGHLADIVKNQLGCDIRSLPGSGAAGGLAAGAIAFLKGRLVSGIDAVISHNRLQEVMSDADWVITGEGCYDEQSLRGKVISGVSRVAKETNTKVALSQDRFVCPWRNIGPPASRQRWHVWRVA